MDSRHSVSERVAALTRKADAVRLFPPRFCRWTLSLNRSPRRRFPFLITDILPRWFSRGSHRSCGNGISPLELIPEETGTTRWTPVAITSDADGVRGRETLNNAKPVPVSSYKLNLRAKRIFGAIRGLALSPDQLKHLIFTHGHSYRQHRRDRAGNRRKDLSAPAGYPDG